MELDVEVRREPLVGRPRKQRHDRKTGDEQADALTPALHGLLGCGLGLLLASEDPGREPERRAEREQAELSGAQDLARKLEKTSLAFVVKTGEGGRMFGAITAQDVQEKLAAAGFTATNGGFARVVEGRF